MPRLDLLTSKRLFKSAILSYNKDKPLYMKIRSVESLVFEQIIEVLNLHANKGSVRRVSINQKTSFLVSVAPTSLASLIGQERRSILRSFETLAKAELVECIKKDFKQAEEGNAQLTYWEVAIPESLLCFYPIKLQQQ